MKDASWVSRLAALAVVSSWIIGCYPEGSLAGGKRAEHVSARPDAGLVPIDDAADTGPVPTGDALTGALCLPARSSDLLRARAPVMSDQVTAVARPVFASHLYDTFGTLCGGCHVQADNGGFKVNAGNFKDKIEDGDKPSVVRMMSDDPTVFMPPPPLGKKYTERGKGDPIVSFVTDLKAWIDKGKPDVFYVDPDPAESGASPYLLSKTVGTQLTNIGNCIPDKHVIGLEKDEMKRLDELFTGITAATDLPATLDGTDLISFDSEKLARYGVIAFAPTYPLFSDNAKKIRYVRVPVGTSIQFNPDTKEFDIPPNTRFYKTFLKHVIDEEGNESYRKIETRLVLSRPDRTLGPEAGAASGTVQVDSIFATWKWNPEETVATRVSTAYQDGTGFADEILQPYELDEVKAKAIYADATIKNKQFELREQGVVRTYAIPGSDRCLQCHMGSVSHAGALGFTPLQIDRRKTGEGGTYEPTGPDELGQLKRLIDYGVITGMTGPGQVSLEKSQSVPPRNDYELKAQAYMVGNCGHCHNPRGYPTVQNPELRDLLNFWPGGGGGIFQFPMDRTSPRIQRGDTLDTPIPYITPSLYDLPRSDPSAALQMDVNGSSGAQPNWYSAPWRSLIYRNVDTPFTYVDDNAIFPHMPMNVAGYDCRAPRIMAEWMISIPAKWGQADYNASVAWDPDKPLVLEGCPTTVAPDAPFCNPGASSCLFDAPCGRRNLPTLANNFAANVPDTSPQPYVEVRPPKPGEDHTAYDQAVSDANTRLGIYHADERFQYYCPDAQAYSDIVDYTIPAHPTDPVPQDGTWFELQNGQQVYQWVADGVPDRADWVATDVTQPPGPWSPRRSDWKTVLVDGDIGARPTDPLDPAQATYDSLRLVVDMLSAKSQNPARLTPELRTFVETPRPMGLWAKPDCTFDDAAQPKATSVSPRPDWFDAPGVTVADDARIYMQPPGSFVFTQICSNCHGRLADSHGRLASKILELTGGNARVASFQAGLFGPTDNPGKYRSDVFDVTAALPGDSFNDGDDLASRYMAFMGLGGTTKIIPKSLLSIVGLTPVFGLRRQGGQATDANMLSIAKRLCRETLPFRDLSDVPTFDPKTGSFSLKFASLQHTNGDGELWPALCSFNNPSPLRTLLFSGSALAFNATTDFYKRSAIGATDLVGDQHGNVQGGIASDNLQPWCIRLPDATPASLAAAETWWAANGKTGQAFPQCPVQAVLDQNKFNSGLSDGPDLIDWVNRGAANAGFSVFSYLDDLTRGRILPPDPYNLCPSPK